MKSELGQWRSVEFAVVDLQANRREEPRFVKEEEEQYLALLAEEQPFEVAAEPDAQRVVLELLQLGKVELEKPGVVVAVALGTSEMRTRNRNVLIILFLRDITKHH